MLLNPHLYVGLSADPFQRCICASQHPIIMQVRDRHWGSGCLRGNVTRLRGRYRGTSAGRREEGTKEVCRGRKIGGRHAGRHDECTRIYRQSNGCIEVRLGLLQKSQREIDCKATNLLW